MSVIEPFESRSFQLILKYWKFKTFWLSGGKNKNRDGGDAPCFLSMVALTEETSQSPGNGRKDFKRKALSLEKCSLSS